jgi:hypothetical protein
MHLIAILNQLAQEGDVLLDTLTAGHLYLFWHNLLIDLVGERVSCISLNTRCY